MFFIIFGIINKSKVKWVGKLYNSNTIFWILIGWVIFGFITKLDYTMRWGCIVRFEPIFSGQNILFTSIALFLLFLGAYLTPKKTGLLILIFELIIWLNKLLFIKGGYVVGVVGGPDISILLYDLLALTLRLLLMNFLLKLNLKNLYLFIVAFLILILKGFV